MKKNASDTFVCCDNCFEKIGRISGKSARLWMELCKWYSSAQGLFVVSKRSNISKNLFQLEQLGFLVTHETNEHTTVKMAGFKTSPCNHFCIGDCDERMH